MDTVRINHPIGHSSRAMPRNRGSSISPASYFIGFFVLFILGLVAGVNTLAAIGLVGYVVSFLYMRETVWEDMMKRKTLRKYFDDNRTFAE